MELGLLVYWLHALTIPSAFITYYILPPVERGAGSTPAAANIIFFLILVPYGHSFIIIYCCILLLLQLSFTEFKFYSGNQAHSIPWVGI